MAEPSTVGDFQAKATAALEWKSKQSSLIARDNWGELNFKDSESYVDRVMRIIDDLVTLPLELIDESNLASLRDQVYRVVSVFERIEKFTTIDMANSREGVANEIRSIHDAIFAIARTEVPFLAIFSGRMQHWQSGARDEYTRTQQLAADTQEQLRIATDAARVARESAGAAGAAEFTAAFRNQANDAAKASKMWLKGTAIAFGLALFATGFFVALHVCGVTPAASTAADAITNLAWKVGTVGLLFGASGWCGRHYRAYRHNHEVSRHRQACLENMQAFQRAVDDQAVKDMVVLEFSRAASQGMPTGFISGKAEARSSLASPQVVSSAMRHATPSDAR